MEFTRRPVKLAVNTFKVEKEEEPHYLYQFHVDFEPQQDSRKFRLDLMKVVSKIRKNDLIFSRYVATFCLTLSPGRRWPPVECFYT
jgi:hypothetical protein